MSGPRTLAFVGQLEDGPTISFTDFDTMCTEATVDAGARSYTLLALGDDARRLSQLAAQHQNIAVTTDIHADPISPVIAALCCWRPHQQHGIDVELVEIRPISHPATPLPFNEGQEP